MADNFRAEGGVPIMVGGGLGRSRAASPFAAAMILEIHPRASMPTR
jgi:hypothetical protein